jgi:chemotaxis protein MotB
MVTLLMTFFVLLFALSTLNAKKFEKLAFSLQSTFGTAPSGGPVSKGSGVLPGAAPVEPAPLPPEESPEAQLLEIQSRIQAYIAESGLSEVMAAEQDPRGLVIRFRDQVLFDLGKADLKPGAMAALDKVGEAIRGIPNDIRIEGHTDCLPINTLRFPTNWDLSAARAVAVLQYLSARFDLPPSRLSIAGYGEYRPVSPNDDEAGRRLNRRVDIVILSTEHSLTEPRETPRQGQEGSK